MDKSYYKNISASIESLMSFLTKNEIIVSNSIYLSISLVTPWLISNINTHIKELLIRYLKELQDINRFLYKTYKKRDSIEEVLLKLETLQEILRNINLYKTFSSQNSLKNQDNVINNLTRWFFNNQLIFINSIIQDLQSDLNQNIIRRKNILESAKSDVANNLKGTPDLMKVSELQQARLDSQIQEFEKLQKILVKV